MNTKTDLKSMTLSRLSEEVAKHGQPKFRAEQIFGWIHAARALSFEEMSNLPASFRAVLAENYSIEKIKIAKKLVSGIDNTIKYLWELFDGNCVESVLMEYKHGNSICISTQVGCRMGCSFCASTIASRVRNLTAGEMLEEIYAAERDSGRAISSVVLMGIGEPLDNFENVADFLEILSSPKGRNMSLRHLSLSTCGLVDQIDRLAALNLGLTLSISLHAPDDKRRGEIMPVNRKHDLKTLMAACKRYFEKTGRRISFEYTLIEGFNDSEQDARQLAHLLKGMPSHVNLINLNRVEETGLSGSGRERIEKFRQQLEKLKINATIRRELGQDIDAACGQLRIQTLNQKEAPN